MKRSVAGIQVVMMKIMLAEMEAGQMNTIFA